MSAAVACALDRALQLVVVLPWLRVTGNNQPPDAPRSGICSIAACATVQHKNMKFVQIPHRLIHGTAHSQHMHLTFTLLRGCAPPTGTEGERLRALAKAADCISIGDTVNCTLRRTNNWSLAPLAGQHMCTDVCTDGSVCCGSGSLAGRVDRSRKALICFQMYVYVMHVMPGCTASGLHPIWPITCFASTGLVGCVMPATYMMGPREVFGLYPGEMNFPR